MTPARRFWITASARSMMSRRRRPASSGSPKFTVMPLFPRLRPWKADAVPFQNGGAPAAGVVAAFRVLDLDDVGAELGEDEAGVWSGDAVADLDNGNPRQGLGARHGRLLASA